LKTIRFIAFFLCCIFSFNTIAVSIDQLIDLYDIPSFSGVSESESKILANTTQAFINNPDNMEKLSTAKGKELLKRQKQLLNLIEIQRVFKSCKQKNASKRKLFMRIYSSASSFNNIEVSCSENITRFSNIYDFSKEVQNLAQEVELDDLQKKY
jgi:hypothetical protein|tara:strand:- start:57 stop:518 length:462 start_codon:yes stop_codon:yes gene_type:complete